MAKNTYLKQWLARYRLIRSNPMDWTSGTKATMIGAITLLFYVQYLVWAIYTVDFSEAPPWLDISYLDGQLFYFYVFTISSLLIFLLFPLLESSFGDSVYYEYFATQYFGISLSYFSYQIGTMSLPVGVVLAGAPILGFIFFDRRAVIFALVTTFSLQIVLSCIIGFNGLPYAPLIVPDVAFNATFPDARWVFYLYGFTMPHLIFLLVLSYVVLTHWRDREERVRVLSVTDPLTGLFNRRSILSYLEHERERSRNKGPLLSLLMVDLDHFKSINDENGHEAGDYALIVAAEALQTNLRQNDRVGRYGGEEFLVVLPGSDLEAAKMIAERCRTQLLESNVMLPSGERLKLSGSIGVVCNEGDVNMTIDEMLVRADQAMYRAKERGRNQTAIYSPITDPELAS